MSETIKFREIADRIRAEFLSSQWVPGRKLASESEYMRRFDVSRITVRNALDKLAEEGLIARGRGKRGVLLQKPPDKKRLRRGFNCGLVGCEDIVDSSRSDLPGVALEMIAELAQWDASLSLFPFCSAGRPDALDFIRRLVQRNLVDGFLLGLTPDIDEVEAFLCGRDIPHVHICGEEVPETGRRRFRAQVLIDELTPARRLAQVWREEGAPGIVLLGSHFDFLPVRTDYLFGTAAREAGLAYRAEHLESFDFRTLCRLLKRGLADGAKMILSNELLGAWECALAYLEVPPEQYSRFLLFKHFAPDWTKWAGRVPIFQTPSREIGHAAARLIREQLVARESGTAIPEHQWLLVEKEVIPLKNTAVKERKRK